MSSDITRLQAKLTELRRSDTQLVQAIVQAACQWRLGPDCAGRRCRYPGMVRLNVHGPVMVRGDEAPMLRERESNLRASSPRNS